MNDMEEGSARNIPNAIARQVRQECYFGCVICGMPVFHYDHIVEFSVVKEHKAENIALLCALHHNDKTTKKLSAERVMEARKRPFNEGRMETTAYKIVENRSVDIEVGTQKVQKKFKQDGTFCVIYVNGFQYLALNSEGGWLSITLIVTDEKGYGLLLIDRGELKVRKAIFDYTYEGNHLIIHSAERNITVDLNLSNEMLRVNRAKFMDASGTGFVVKNESMLSVKRGKLSAKHTEGLVVDTAGGWAIWDTSQFPNAKPPVGFGFAEFFQSTIDL